MASDHRSTGYREDFGEDENPITQERAAALRHMAEPGQLLTNEDWHSLKSLAEDLSQDLEEAGRTMEHDGLLEEKHARELAAAIHHLDDAKELTTTQVPKDGWNAEAGRWGKGLRAAYQFIPKYQDQWVTDLADQLEEASNYLKK